MNLMPGFEMAGTGMSCRRGGPGGRNSVPDFRRFIISIALVAEYQLPESVIVLNRAWSRQDSVKRDA